MRSYEQALNEIYAKADERLIQINRRKKRTRMILFSALPVCLVLTIVLSVGIGLGMRDTTPPLNNDTIDNVLNSEDTSIHNSFTGYNSPTGYDPNRNEDVDSSDNIDIDKTEPGIYPWVWKKMNAVVVKWGGITDRDLDDRYYPDGRDTGEYAIVDVEFVKIYSDTMTESDIPNAEKTIGETAYLIIPKYCLNEIKAGDMSLVFLDLLGNIINQDSNGKSTVTCLLGVRLGDRLASGRSVPAPIFAVSNGKVSVPDDSYETDSENDEYYMAVMNSLQAANEYIRKGGNEKIAVFEDGVDVEELADFFAYVCGN